MAKQLIDTEGTTDTLQSGFEKVNANFEELYESVAATPAIASQEQAEGGTDNATLMTPLRTAQAIAELGASGEGGGAGVATDPDIAYVRTGGNDSTGDGTLAAPWASAQHAFNEGYRIIDIIGYAGDIAGAVLDLTLVGHGAGVSSVGAITGTSGYVKGNGRGAMFCGAITIAAVNGSAGAAGSGPGAAGDNGNEGASAPNTVVTYLSAGAILLRGGNGGAGGGGGVGDFEISGGFGGAGGTGGAGGELTVKHCLITDGNVTSKGGAGGVGGTGAYGTGSGNGGNGGNGGTPGTVRILNCDLGTGLPSAPASEGGAGGDGGSSGTTGAPGSVGQIYTTFSVHGSPTSGETITKAGSVISGTFYSS